MPDMLVRLFDLPASRDDVSRLAAIGVVCRGAESYERSSVLKFVGQHFPHWRDEVSASFSTVPPTCAIATRDGLVLGFACWEATRPNYFGPTGVAVEERGSGIGRALLLLALEALKVRGYGYAIIGGVGPTAFYEKAVDAALIPGSDPGIYRDMLARGDD